MSNRVLYIDICLVFPGRCTDPRALWEASLVQITAALPAYEFLLCPMPPLRKTPCAISIDMSMVGISPPVGTPVATEGCLHYHYHYHYHCHYHYHYHYQSIQVLIVSQSIHVLP